MHRAAVDLGRSAAEASRLLRILSNENRLMLVCLLLEEERTVGQLNKFLPLSQSALSQHLAVLREEGVVSARRVGQNVFYGLASAPARRVIETLHAVYCP
jgi:DNA-binding transcriptional ArsR family regulator